MFSNRNERGQSRDDQPELHPGFETAQFTEAQEKFCNDQIEVITLGQRKIIVLADGAGSSQDATLGAKKVLTYVRRFGESVTSSREWAQVLKQIDYNIEPIQSTAVIIDISPEHTLGASVGDSEAAICFDNQLIGMTDKQNIKPLLGSGQAQPVPFDFGALTRPLIVGSDGFWKYVDRSKVLPTLISSKYQFFDTPRNLAELVRLPNGKLHDDVGIVVCRPVQEHRSRQRYSI